MTRYEKISLISEVISAGKVLTDQQKMRIEEKTDEQLNYILSPIDQCIYLEACAGSGKTEVLGLKAAYEICRWTSNQSGIVVLTFTNEATSTIVNRVSTFYRKIVPLNHFIGTFSSFVHGHIAQRFGYQFYDFPEEKADKLFRIVDSDISPYNNNWLENYKLNFPLPKKSIYASQLNYRISSREWFVGQGEYSRSLSELYNSEECQQYIENIRQRRNAPYLFQHDYLIEQANACKLKFLKEGFATFEDMNLIARKCLKNETVCHYIAKKFPVILVDECQDLSSSELNILHLLIRAGTTVHYIGDLHQAIYSFKDSYPEQLTAHIERNNFKTMRLNKNFRSTQRIVDFSRKLSGIDYPITGAIKSKCGNYDCAYLEYNNENEAIALFIDILRKFEIPIENAVVLVRTQSSKKKLTGGQSKDYKMHPIINAIKFWQQNEPLARQTALNLLAFQLQKWLGFHGRSNNYYYSDELCSSSVIWKLLLRDILVDFCSDPTMSNMENSTYSSWYSTNKAKIAEVINFHLHRIGKVLIETNIKSPKGTANSLIELLNLAKKSQIRIETIHSVKGDTFDAVLLLSTPNGHGKSGYWENWFNVNEESGRIAYVASTRPRYLLCWGINKLSPEQRQKLGEFGLNKLEQMNDPHSR